MSALKDRYVNPLTDFGFKKLFGTEPNKVLLIDFLNQVLPERHQIKELTYLKNEHLGLDDLDRKVLQSIIEKFGGGPVGLETIAASISEESSTIMDVVEPYLLQLGFLDRTPRGRVATPHAYEHMGLDTPDRPEQPSLF